MAKHIAFLVAVLALFASVWPHGPQRAHASTEPLLVLAGLKYPDNDISLVDLQNAFRGRTVFVRGRRLTPLNHPLGTPLRVSADARLLGLSPAEVGRYWVDRRIRDDGVPPKAPPTADLTIRVVAVLPNAITYGSASMVSSSVKALTVDGVAAGAPGYALARQ